MGIKVGITEQKTDKYKFCGKSPVIRTEFYSKLSNAVRQLFYYLKALKTVDFLTISCVVCCCLNTISFYYIHYDRWV